MTYFIDTSWTRNRHNNLAGGTRRRLSEYKNKLRQTIADCSKRRTPEAAAEWIKNLGYDAPDAWKRERWVTPHGQGFTAPGEGVSRSRSYGGVLFMDSGALDHLREIAADDKTRTYGDSAWYTDDDGCRGTITGKVVQLPTHKGQRRWLAFAVHSEDDGITVDSTVYDDPVAACNNADRLASRMAEEEREHNAKWDAATDLDREIDDAKDELHEARGEANAALHAYGEQRELGEVSKSVERLLFEQLAAARAQMRRCIETLAEKRAARADIDVET